MPTAKPISVTELAENARGDETVRQPGQRRIDQRSDGRVEHAAAARSLDRRIPGRVGFGAAGYRLLRAQAPMG